MTYAQPLISSLTQIFKEKYQKEYDLIFSPGRINLIGEHTDYNDGFVMPAAIDKGIYIVFSKNKTGKLRAYSYDFDNEFIVDIDAIERTSVSWANYILGVIEEIKKINPEIEGFDMVFGGNIPIGSGLSSSAALECGVGTLLNELFELDLTTTQIIKAGQQAEHSFVGVRCGIMDQFASAFGKEDRIIRLDCKTLDYEYFPLMIPEYQILLCNSKVKHSLAESSYNERREECEAGVKIIKESYPEVTSLRDVTITMLASCKDQFSDIVYKRCSYVIEENQRVLQAGQFLEKDNLPEIGRLLFDSHKGLSEKYEVSCKELDFLVDQVKEDTDVLGSRMMGGGFGGCTINIVKKSKKSELIESLKSKYYEKFQIELECYDVTLVNGTHSIKNN